MRTPQGWREAYRKYVDGGWNSVPFDPEHGGQGVAVADRNRGAGDVAVGQHGLRLLPNA